MNSRIYGCAFVFLICVIVLSLGAQSTYASLPESEPDSSTLIAYQIKYVDWSNGNDNDNGDVDHPWQTITHAAQNASAGMEIRILPDTYYEDVTFDAVGTSSPEGDIRWVAYGGTVYVDGVYTCFTVNGDYNTFIGPFHISSCAWEGVVVSASNSRFEGFFLYNTGDCGFVNIYNSNNIFEHCSATNCDDQGFFVANSTDTTFSWCAASDCDSALYIQDCANTTFEEGVLINSNYGVEVNSSTYTWIFNNSMSSNYTSIYSYGDSYDYNDNLHVYYCDIDGYTTGIDIDQYSTGCHLYYNNIGVNSSLDYGIKISDCSAIIPSMNYIVDCDESGIEISNSNGTSLYGNHIVGSSDQGIKITNGYGVNLCQNRVCTNGYYGIFIDDGCTSFNFENNVVCGSFSQAAMFDRDSGSGFNYYYNTFKNLSGVGYYGRRKYSSAYVVEFKNNIVYSESNYAMRIADDDGANEEYWWHSTNSSFLTNCYFSDGADIAVYGGVGRTLGEWQSDLSPLDSTSINQDPLFRDDDSINLTSTSQCINNATAIPAITTVDNEDDDRDGTSPDIGADEYTSGGNVYYIRTDGNDRNSGLSGEAYDAWQTIIFAETVLQPGDTVYIAPGTYDSRVFVTADGTSTDWITFEGDPTASHFPSDVSSGDVIIDGHYQGLYFDGESGGSETNDDDDECSYLIFRNLKIISCSNEAIYMKQNCHDIIIENFDLTNTGAGSDRALIWLRGYSGPATSPKNIQIQLCTMSTYGKYGVYVTDYCQNIDIMNNEISHFRYCGICVKNYCSTNCVIGNNCIKEPYAGADHGLRMEYCGSEWTIYNNMISGAYDGATVHDYNNGADFTWDHNSFYNYKTGDSNAYAFYGWKGSSNANIVSFRNNILAIGPESDANHIIAIYGPTPERWFPVLNYGGVMDKNCYHGPDGVMGYIDDGSLVSANLAQWASHIEQTVSYSPPCYAEDNSFIADPLFDGDDDLHIDGVNSPCLNNGTPQGYTDDIDGDARSATNPSIGADEG